jgi:hypothetical protein
MRGWCCLRSVEREKSIREGARKHPQEHIPSLQKLSIKEPGCQDLFFLLLSPYRTHRIPEKWQDPAGVSGSWYHLFDEKRITGMIN